MSPDVDKKYLVMFCISPVWLQLVEVFYHSLLCHTVVTQV